MIKLVVKNGVQTITEICEHCAQPARALHISDITFKHPSDAIITIKDADNNDIVVKTKEERITELTSSYIRKGLLDEGEAEDAITKKTLKWGIRPAAMCSESIDIIANVTQSYCYRSTNEDFLAKYSASFSAASVFNVTGSKVGMDYKGNVVRVKSEKKLDQADSAVKYKGPEVTGWWREISDDSRTTYITRAYACEALHERYGVEAVKTMKFVSNFENEEGLVRAFSANRCPR